MSTKTILITGITKGIGRAIAERYAKEGYKIIGCARSLQSISQMETYFKKHYPNIELLLKPVDMGVEKDVNKFAEWVQSRFTTIDVLVNNAGLFIPGQILMEEKGVLEKMINTNLYSAYYLTRALVPQVLSATGHIFMMCSTASITPYINGGSYCISKYALYGMTKVLREELKEHNVRVTAILPGATLTASWEGVQIPEERFMKPEDVAEAVYSANQMSVRSVVEEILIRPQLGDL